MKCKCWLIVTENGSIKSRKNKPDLRANEVPVLIELNIPDELFERPALKATVTVPRESYMESPLTADVQNNVQDLIEQATGMAFDVTLTHSQEEDGES